MNKRITLLVLGLFILNSNYTSASDSDIENDTEDNSAFMLQHNAGNSNLQSLYRNIREQTNMVAAECNSDDMIRNYRSNILRNLRIIINDIRNHNIDDNTINDLHNIIGLVTEFENYCSDHYDDIYDNISVILQSLYVKIHRIIDLVRNMRNNN